MSSHPEQAESSYDLQVRILPALRSLPSWSTVEIAWEQAAGPLREIAVSTSDLADAFTGIGDGGGATGAVDLAGALRASARSLREIVGLVDHFIFEPDPAMIYWAELSSDRRRLALNAAPLAVGPLVEKHLWNEKDFVVVTSATLTTAGEFHYLKRRLHAETADELALGSPFDYETSTLLYLINDIPEPADRHGYERAVERALAGVWPGPPAAGLWPCSPRSIICAAPAAPSRSRWPETGSQSTSRATELRATPCWRPSGPTNRPSCSGRDHSGKGSMFPAKPCRYW